MRSIRRLLRLMGLLLVIKSFFLIVTAGLLLLLVSGRWDARPRFVTIAHRWMSRLLLSILGITVLVDGRENEGREMGGNLPGLLISNHLGYLDVLIIGSRYETTFVAKSEVAGWPLIGWLARLGGTIFLRRGDTSSSVRAVYLAGRRLRTSRQLHVFPEGTTTDGRSIATFHPLFFAAAIRGRQAVLPLTLRIEEVVEKGRPVGSANELLCWYGESSLLPHLWRLLLIDSARVLMVAHRPLVTSRSDRAAGIARRAEEVIRGELTGQRDDLQDQVTEPGDWSVELVTGALLYSLLASPRSELVQDIISSAVEE